MDLKELLRNGLVEEAVPDREICEHLLKEAEKNLVSAEGNLKIRQYDWALAIAYNSMLSAGRALMARKGYKPVSDSHHLAVVRFCTVVLPAGSGALVKAFNSYRGRRHDVVYGEPDEEAVGEEEAATAIAKAREFVAKIKAMVK